MKHLAVAAIVITILILNMVSDLHFKDGTQDGKGWDALGLIAVVGGIAWFIYARKASR